jgi:hypothetical protein
MLKKGRGLCGNVHVVEVRLSLLQGIVWWIRAVLVHERCQFVL